jgi:hypothetical protein
MSIGIECSLTLDINCLPRAGSAEVRRGGFRTGRGGGWGGVGAYPTQTHAGMSVAQVTCN